MKKSELRSLIRECVCDALKEVSTTGWESYSDSQLQAKFKDFERRKYDLTAQASKDFIDLKKEMSNRNLKESTLKEATMVDFANYYRAYDSEVKTAAKALDKIIEESGAGSEELFDAITDLVDAVRADQDAEI